MDYTSRYMDDIFLVRPERRKRSFEFLLSYFLNIERVLRPKDILKINLLRSPACNSIWFYGIAD